ncbi:MAG: hypothetical protein V3W34_02445, partial [Phycisphaerae bacterium]
MRRSVSCVLVLGVLCLPVFGQTVFLEAQPGATVDLTDPLNPSVLAGNQIVVEVLLDGTAVAVPQVAALDIELRINDPGAPNPGTLECADYIVDTGRADLAVDSCSLCSATCGPPIAAGLLDVSSPWKDVDFVAYVATITLDASAGAEGDWVLGYGTGQSNVLVGSVDAIIIDIVNDPGSFQTLTITVRPLTGACCLAPVPTCQDDVSLDECENTLGGVYQGDLTTCPPNPADLCKCFVDLDCDDGVICNGAEVCSAGTCLSGGDAVAGTPCGDPTNTDCNLADTCNGSGVCLGNIQPNGTLCDDGVFCTEGETCLGGVCQGGGATDCDDGLLCTTDSCNTGLDECDNDLNAGFCLIDGSCHVNAEPNPANECELCNPLVSTVSWSPVGDGLGCTDDGNDCTDDVCTTGVCTHPSLSIGTPCDDGDPCTGTGEPGIGIDTCDGAGNCSGVLDPDCNDDCGQAVAAFEGLNSGSNVTAAEDEVEASCQLDSNHDVWFFYDPTCNGEVQMKTSASSFLPEDDSVLSVYDACGGIEIACDDDSGLGLHSALTLFVSTLDRYWIRVAGFQQNVGAIVLEIRTLDDCLIDNICYGEGSLNPANDCEACITDVSTTSWSPVLKGTSCGDPSTSDCDSPDACDGMGTCEINHKVDGIPCPDDGNECTDDVCSVGDCVHPNHLPGFACGSSFDDDCDNPDTCNGAGLCLTNLEAPGFPCGSGSDTDCDNPDTCDGNGGCLQNFEPNGTGCTDEGNDCTSNLCEAGECTHPNLPDNTACNDGQDCTVNDKCAGGICLGAQLPAPIVESGISSRFIRVRLDPLPDTPVALRITNDCSGAVGWVRLEDSAVDDGPNGIISVAVATAGNDCLLGADFLTPSQWSGSGTPGTVYIKGTTITPEAQYTVEALCDGCQNPFVSESAGTVDCT